MTRSFSKKIITKQDILIIAILLFLVTIFAVGYDAYQKSKTDTQDVTVEVPPVVVNSLDIKVFDRLREMK